MTKYARLDAFAIGQITAYAKAGEDPCSIAKKVSKPKGGKPTVHAVRAIIRKSRKQRSWRGTRVHVGGRVRDMNKADEDALCQIVVQNRGTKVVTINYCQKVCKSLRKFSRWVLARALHRAGLKWLRRRVKSFVPADKRGARLVYANWLLRQDEGVFRKFSYLDGTTFYLARTEDEGSEQGQRRLGSHVWRMSTGKDGLYSDNVGPSLYASSQGRPVKVWGMLSNGVFSYQVLPADGNRTTHMNGARYRRLLTQNGVKWLRKSHRGRKPRTAYLVHDHERCLYQKDRSLFTFSLSF